MKVVSIEWSWYPLDVPTVVATSRQALLDFDLITLDQQAAAETILSESGDAVELAEELRRALLRGRTLVIFPGVNIAEYDYYARKMPCDAFLPEVGGWRVERTGHDIRATREPFRRFLEECGPVEYTAYYEKAPGDPVMFVAETDLVVGWVARVEDGLVLGLPKPTGDRGVYLAALERLLVSLTGPVEIGLPEWARSLKYGREPQLTADRRAAEDELLAAQAKADRLDLEIEAAASNKMLVAGAGRALEQAAKRVLAAVGFLLVDGEQGRADLVGDHRGRPVVIEVKSKGKSASLEEVRQLDTWVFDYMQAHGGVEPKAVAIVNAFRDVPLAERDQNATFPDNVLRHAVARHQCLMTGTQLLGLYAASLVGDVSDDIDSVFQTDGAWDRYLDWHAFMVEDFAE